MGFLKKIFLSLQFKNFTPREAVITVTNLNHVTMYVPNGQICLECGDDFQESNHIRSISKCAKCKFQSACSRAILEHISNCNGETDLDSIVPCALGKEMFCICGYSSSEGAFFSIYFNILQIFDVAEIGSDKIIEYFH